MESSQTMCKAVTKNGTQCLVSVGLVDDMCARHRKAAEAALAPPAEPCQILLTRGARKGETCGAPIVRNEKCKRHLAEKIQRYTILVAHEGKMRVCLGPFTDLEKCLDEARRLFADDEEYEELESDDSKTSIVFRLKSEKISARIFRMIDPPKRSKKTTEEQKYAGPVCGYLYTKGKDKGLRCGKKCQGDFALCAKHGGREEPTTGCEFVNKSKHRCGKEILRDGLCEKHQPAMDVGDETQLPEEVKLETVQAPPPPPPSPQTVPPMKKRRAPQVPNLEIVRGGAALQHTKDIVEIQLDIDYRQSSALDEIFDCPLSDDCVVYIDEQGDLLLQNPGDVTTYDSDIVFLAVEKTLEFLGSDRAISSIAYNGKEIVVKTQ